MKKNSITAILLIICILSLSLPIFGLSAADVNGSGTVNAADSLLLRYKLTHSTWK